MIGAIIGDLAGSIYEYEQTKNITPIKTETLINKDSFFSDDTILTIAIADAIINKANYEDKLRKYALKYNLCIPKDVTYFKTMFSPNFIKWAQGKNQGNSLGNGAMMRISPVGYLFNSKKEVIKHAKLATIPSHNTKEAISCATTIALIIFYARTGLNKEQIKNKLNLSITKPNIKTFNYTCAETIDVCLYSLFSANDFEESIKIALSFGGDTDTNACIVGSMAEALYGINNSLKTEALKKLPTEFVDILNKCYNINM